MNQASVFRQGQASKILRLPTVVSNARVALQTCVITGLWFSFILRTPVCQDYVQQLYRLSFAVQYYYTPHLFDMTTTTKQGEKFQNDRCDSLVRLP